MRKNYGFSLVELVIVIAVIGILAAILIPTFSNVIKKANAKSALSDARNTVSEFVTNKLQDDTEGSSKNLPENIVIIVKKAGLFFIYGYNTSGTGEVLMANAGEGFEVDPTGKKLDTIDDLLTSTLMFNVTHPGESVDPTRTDYTIEEHGVMYLATYNEQGSQTGDIRIKSFIPVPENETSRYRCLTDEMDRTMGDETYIYHGVLLNGTFSIDTNNNGGGQGGESGGETPEEPKPNYTITFAAGTCDEDFDPTKVILPNEGSKSFAEGSIFIPSNYSASYDFDPATESGYIFDGWDVDGSFTITENKTITAKWLKQSIEKFTLSFDANGGTLNLADGVTSGMQIPKGTDITSYITQSTAQKDGCQFISWSDGENIYNSESSNLVMTGDLTLTAQFDDIMYSLTINPDNGTAAYKLGDYKFGAKVTLPAAPVKDDLVFNCWKADDSEIEYSANGEYTMPAKNVTITAIWTGYVDVTVSFYDTWNEVSFQGETVRVLETETTLDFDSSWDFIPEYWVQDSNPGTITGNQAIFNGERHNTNVSGDVGTEYIIVSNITGLSKIGGSKSGTPTQEQAEAALAKNYWLLNDISASSLSQPIGWTDNEDCGFEGIFDGNNKTISGLNLVYGDEASFVGLFAINNGTMKNFNLTVSQVKSGEMAGSVCGANCGTLMGIDVALPNYGVWATYGKAGGICGENALDASIIDCSVYSTVSGAHYNVVGGDTDAYLTQVEINGDGYYEGVFIGGITGINSGTISKCGVGNTNKFGVSTKTYYNSIGYWNGGIAGINHSGTISECYAYRVQLNRWTTDSSYVGLQNIGGIAGGNKGNISDCFTYNNLMTVYSGGGGIVGNNLSGGSISTSWVTFGGANYNTGTTYDDIGINNGTVSNCYDWYYNIGANVFDSSTYSTQESIYNQIPSGFSTSIWTASESSGPRLINNPLRSY